MAKRLSKWIRGLQEALMEVIMPIEDKSIWSGKIFWSRFHIKKTIEQLKNRWPISSTYNLHREHIKQRETPLFWTSNQ